MRRLCTVTIALVFCASASVSLQQPQPVGPQGQPAPTGRGQAGQGGGAGPIGGPGRGPQAANRTSVLVLGAGSPGINAERSGTCLGVIVNGTVYLFDAGAGVERRMFEARARANINNLIQTIGPVFITHMHSDHTLGLPAMLYYVRPQGQPFKVYGPPGIKNMMTHILAAWQEDRDMRVNGLERANPVRWETDVHEVTSGVVFKDDNVTVKAFEVPHGSWEHALGYRIDSANRSIVISGDTHPSDAIVDACNGCDVLFHEVVWEDPDGQPRSAYMKEFHTSPAEIGDIATRAKAKMVVLYHQVGAQPAAEYIRVVASKYKGPVAFARDLELY
jgi:ribonuclease BN (tRNA processing enzyme)